ncbi:MAG: tyrosine-type recombinase/integrase [Nitrospira sp.]|nr:tyrosine-type recombinase/integrase [Nitrospira sp.]
MALIRIYCGVRLKSEGLTLRWSDIDFGRGTVSVQVAYLKSSKPRTIPMSSLVREALGRLPPKSEWVFTKPTGTPYTARSPKGLMSNIVFGVSKLGTLLRNSIRFYPATP